MKKILALILGLLLCSNIFAKQYFINTTTSTTIHDIRTARELQDNLVNLLNDLIIKEYKIVQVIPIMADGTLIGYIVLYEDKE